MHRIRFVLIAAMLLLFMSGCVEMRVDGDAKIFQSSAVGFFLRVLTGIGLMILGALSLLASVLPDRKPRNQYEASQGGLTTQHRMGLAVFGMGMGVFGLGLLGFSLIFISDLHVTVYPDRVSMASTFSQTGGKEIVVPFDNVKSVEMRDELNTVRKLRTYLVFNLKDGRTIRQEAGGNEREAFDTIKQSLANYQANPPKVARTTEPLPDMSAETSLSAIPGLGGFAASAGNAVNDAKSGSSVAKSAANNAKEYELRRYQVTAPIPSDYSKVEEDTDLKVGSKLKVCFVGKWSNVTVLAVNDDGTIIGDMDGWANHTYKMMREDLIMPNPTVFATPLPSSAASKTAQELRPSAPPTVSRFPSQGVPKIPANVVLKRYPISIPLPAGYSNVKADTEVPIGTKLGACYNKHWENVTVLAINSDGTITCSWDNWPGFVYKMLREDLTIAK